MSGSRMHAVAAILLAGGSGARMRPLTAQMNKHLIPIHLRPMIEYSLGTLLGLGFARILVVTGARHVGQVVDLLGAGSRYGNGVAFTYKVQEEAGGIAQALSLGREYAAGRRVAVMLGDNVFDDDGTIREAVREFAATDVPDAVNFLARVDDARAYGVATVDGERVVRIEEKPAAPSSNLAVTGLYLYPGDVFDRIGTLVPSARGELEVSDLNNLYAAEGRLRFREVAHWFDAGEPEPWRRTQDYVVAHPDRFGPERFCLREDPR